MALNGLLCVVKKLLSDAVMLNVVEYERKADVRSLEHVDDDLAALRRLRAMAQCRRRVFLQCVLAWILCRVLSDVPRHRADS